MAIWTSSFATFLEAFLLKGKKSEFLQQIVWLDYWLQASFSTFSLQYWSGPKIDENCTFEVRKEPSRLYQLFFWQWRVVLGEYHFSLSARNKNVPIFLADSCFRSWISFFGWIAWFSWKSRWLDNSNNWRFVSLSKLEWSHCYWLWANRHSGIYFLSSRDIPLPPNSRNTSCGFSVFLYSHGHRFDTRASYNIIRHLRRICKNF